MTDTGDRPISDAERREVAFHEAAHAVIGRRLGFCLTKATIVGNEGSYGLCDWKLLSGFGGALVWLAGPVATTILATELGSEPLLDDSALWPDERDAWNLIAVLTAQDDAASESVSRLLKQLARTTLTTDVVRKQVQDVADALFERGELSAARIDEVMAKSAG